METLLVSYPEGVDCVWLASDRDGNVAAFATGGAGPIPKQALSPGYMEIFSIEEAIYRIPIAEGKTILRDHSPGSFNDFSARGIFSYDWTDVNRVKNFVHGYERISAPDRPIKAHLLPTELRLSSQQIVFFDCIFLESKTLILPEDLTPIRSSYL